MSLRARLTLWSVLLMILVVGVLAAVDLSNEVQQQFETALERADFLRRVATDLVIQTLRRKRTLPMLEALRDPDLSQSLVQLIGASRVVLEIAICDLHNNIVAGSDPDRLGMTCSAYPDFRPVVEQTGALTKIRILLRGQELYDLKQPLGTEKETLLTLKVVVYPLFIREKIMLPRLKRNLGIALGSIVVAAFVTLLFSTIAFRPISKLGHMLDLLTRGEYEPPPVAPPADPKRDEFGIMASKVSLLGAQLRGARYDFTDLRGNLERLLDELEDAVLIFGRDRRLVVASGAVEKFLGKMRADLLGLTLGEIFPPSTTLGLLLAQASQTGRPMRNRRVPISSNGASDGSMSVVQLSVDILENLATEPGAGQVTGLLIRLRDPEATQQITRRLQMADRLSAISGITSGVAHEVKNPLNAILMHIELARMKLTRSNYAIESHIDTISTEILRLDRVVKTFLDFTRPVELRLVDVSVDAFVDELVNLARPQATANGIRIVVDDTALEVDIRVDRDLMKQALLNIVVNALDAMEDGGELRFSAALAEDQVEIRIADTGPGIPPELREKIFRLYFTTKKQGSGIGLAMTFRIVQLHDGTIDFSSEPGKGTTFVVRLPPAM